MLAPLLKLTPALIIAVSLLNIESIYADEKPIKVYLLAGQSNMDGYGGIEALRYQATKGDPDRQKVFKHLLKGEGFAQRDDVWITYKNRKGPLTAGYGVGKLFFGVEWEFGNKVGDFHDEKVLLIKTSWGGASIRRKFRPPSSGLPKELIQKEFEQQLKRYEKALEKNKKTKKPNIEDIKKIYGANYRRMIEEIQKTLSNIKSVIPQYKDQGYEIAGFVWFQGFNDQFSDAHKEYSTHLANLIRDIRKEFKLPQLPVIIGQLGHGGTPEEREKRKLKPIAEGTKGVKRGQAQVVKMKEFKGSVSLVPTDVFWDWKAQAVFDKGWRKHFEEWKTIGAHFPYHYLGSPYTFTMAGGAFGDAMIKLHKKSK